MAELVDGIRPLSSFGIHEQRAILALVEAADAPPAEFTPEQEAELRKEVRQVAYETAREATRAVLSARRVTRPDRQASVNTEV